MILAFDTYYFENKARTVCLSFVDWDDAHKLKADSEILEGIADYEPGNFYKRELPSILSLLSKLAYQKIEAIIIDGFVFLDDEEKAGLGAHLYQALEEKIPVIGVAKSNFATLNKNKREVFRGGSNSPLFITSAGLDLDSAAEKIKRMYGKHRIPGLLKELDQLTKLKA